MAPLAVADLLAALELISRARPDRVLRLTGWLQCAPEADAGPEQAIKEIEAIKAAEPFELLIFRGFSSSLSHPTGFDPDQPALPAAAVIEAAELLIGPLNPSQPQRLAGPAAVEGFLDPAAWR